MDDARAARDQRLLLFSIWASAGFAVLSSVWGILSGSSMIVFDGVPTMPSAVRDGSARTSSSRWIARPSC